MVESTALEMRHTGNRIGGSNPSLSATPRREELQTNILRLRGHTLVLCESNVDVTTDRGSQPLITCEQSRIEDFGQRHIDSVVSRKIVPQGPDARQKEIMRVPVDGEIGKIG